MLFTVNDSPYGSSSLASAIETASQGCALMLYEDGVWAAKMGTPAGEVLKAASHKLSIFALKEDLEARGIREVVPEVTVVDYAGFVDLVTNHKVVPWL